MNTWLVNHFFNPTCVAGGAFLRALPIIIHLINQMRFRWVRFAAPYHCRCTPQSETVADVGCYWRQL